MAQSLVIIQVTDGAGRQLTCCIVDGYYCCVLDRHCFFLQDCMHYMQVICLFYNAEFSPFCNSYYLFALPFLSKQTRHGRNIVSFNFLLFITGRAECLSREQCVGWRT